MIEFTKMTEANVESLQNYILIKRGADTIHAVSVTNYHKYLSVLLL